MIVRRWFFAFLALAAIDCALPAARGEDPAAGPVAPVQALCDALLAAMKRGPELDFAQRAELLGPEIRRVFDLALMTRLIVGPSWRNLSASEQEQLVEAFSDYSVATYVQRFKSYSGERFEVDPSPAPLPRGDRVVHTKLFPSGPKVVQLDYLTRATGDRWRIIDVYLNGTISELVARRSEYSATLRQGGAPALIALLRKKTAELGG